MHQRNATSIHDDVDDLEFTLLNNGVSDTDILVPLSTSAGVVFDCLHTGALVGPPSRPAWTWIPFIDREGEVIVDNVKTVTTILRDTITNAGRFRTQNYLAFRSAWLHRP